VRPGATIAENFDLRIRVAPSEGELGNVLREMWCENSKGRLTDADARQLDAAASARRRDLKRFSRQQSSSLSTKHNGPDASPQPFQLPLSPQIPVRVPLWIGGAHEFMRLDEAKRAFRLQRDQWHKQFNRDNRVSKIDLRVATEIFYGLNGDL